MAETWLTPEEIQKREERLEYLKTARRLEIAEALKIARGFGDLSENAEYDAAKNEQAKNEYDIVQLENELKNAKVIDAATLDTKVVNVGATVNLINLDTKAKMSFQIVGSAETDPVNGRISNESPIGKAMLGRKAGDVVDVGTPGGLLRLKIASIGKELRSVNNSVFDGITAFFLSRFALPPLRGLLHVASGDNVKVAGGKTHGVWATAVQAALAHNGSIAAAAFV